MELFTIGTIVTATDEPVHRVEYAIKSRGIKPVALCGAARVFDKTGYDRIVAALKESRRKRRIPA